MLEKLFIHNYTINSAEDSPSIAKTSPKRTQANTLMVSAKNLSQEVRNRHKRKYIKFQRMHLTILQPAANTV